MCSPSYALLCPPPQGKFEFTYVSKSSVIVKELKSSKRIVLKSVFGWEINKINIYKDRCVWVGGSVVRANVPRRDNRIKVDACPSEDPSSPSPLPLIPPLPSLSSPLSPPSHPPSPPSPLPRLPYFTAHSLPASAA